MSSFFASPPGLEPSSELRLGRPAGGAELFPKPSPRTAIWGAGGPSLHSTLRAPAAQHLRVNLPRLRLMAIAQTNTILPIQRNECCSVYT
eukprot:scaffold54224_cov17-Prasinocladus_malaysianus.AAC.1